METTVLGIAAQRSIANRIETRAMQTLMGMVTGMVADAELDNREIAFLNTWLAEHPETASQWPACVIASQVREVLADGVVTDDERSHLLSVLTEMSNTDFAATGSASSEPLRLPIDDACTVAWPNAGVVLTGAFLYGTRVQCQALTEALGAIPLETVTKKTGVLVIGTRVSPTWITESYGRKIMKAAEMQRDGFPIHIVSERYWFDYAKSIGKAA
jgi:NAD-dependent DNA ligase